MNANPQKFLIQHAARKGLAMSATGLIARDKRVLTEPALIELQIGPEVLYNDRTFYDSKKRWNGYEVMEGKWNMLDAHAQAALEALYVWYRKGLLDKHRLLAIISTNAFERPVVVDGVNHIILYVGQSISRINHSCDPNAVVHWDDSSDQATLYAIKSIDANDEITVDYMAEADDFLQLRSHRRTQLKADYGFSCACTACTLTRAGESRHTRSKNTAASLRKELLKARDVDMDLDADDEQYHKRWSETGASLQDYVAGLESLGARDGKLIEAYEWLADFHEATAGELADTSRP
ncbi:hypothetical protein LTR53_013675, partial [Teratosphaeriaceae sp. CCFEE 6253]